MPRENVMNERVKRYEKGREREAARKLYFQVFDSLLPLISLLCPLSFKEVS
jgi:hypothetical protein